MNTENASLTVSGAPKKGKKYFSVSEANRALPYVSKIVREVIEGHAERKEMGHEIDRCQDEKDRDQLFTGYERLTDKLNDLLDELHQVGVELKDWEKGLIDFPAVHQGREICLCWHHGEQCVHAWHETDAGFAGRQDVSMLEPE